MVEHTKKSNTFTILFLLLLLGVLLTLLFHVYFKPETLGLEIKNYGVLSSTSGESEFDQMDTIKLYFTNEKTDGLFIEEREIPKTEDPVVRAKIILEELIAGPENQLHYPVVPIATKINSVFILNDMVIVDLSRDIVQKCPGGVTHEKISVQSIVNTLCELSDVRKVQFLVAHNPIDTLAGHLNMRGAIFPDKTLIR